MLWPDLIQQAGTASPQEPGSIPAWAAPNAVFAQVLRTGGTVPRAGARCPPFPADSPGPGCWCMDAKHGEPGKLVTTVRHGQGKRWLARWVDHDGNERTRSFDQRNPPSSN